MALIGWLGTYDSQTLGCQGLSRCTWLMSEGNIPLPDISLRILPEKGGQSWIENDYPVNAPELIIELAVSNKLKLYRRMNVREYLVVLTDEEKLIWNILTPQGYQALEPDADGILRSRFFPGLWLDVKAFWSRDKSRLSSVLQQGLASPERAVADLASRRVE